jgi:hypothetical protein
MILLFTSFTVTSGFPQKNVPLPQEIKIVPPPPDIPPEVAAFSGRWEGVWEGVRLESILIVEEINSQEAKVIFAWGDAPIWRINKDYHRYVAKVIPGPPTKIKFLGRAGQKFTFEMKKDFKTIKGTREFKNNYSVVTMKHAER